MPAFNKWKRTQQTKLQISGNLTNKRINQIGKLQVQL